MTQDREVNPIELFRQQLQTENIGAMNTQGYIPAQWDEATPLTRSPLRIYREIDQIKVSLHVADRLLKHVRYTNDEHNLHIKVQLNGTGSNRSKLFIERNVTLPCPVLKDSAQVHFFRDRVVFSFRIKAPTDMLAMPTEPYRNRLNAPARIRSRPSQKASLELERRLI